MKFSHVTPFTWKRLVITLSLLTIASLLRIWPLGSLGSTLAWLTFYPAVMVISVYGGLWSGLLGTALTCIITNFFWFLIVSQPFIKNKTDIVGMSVFVFTGAMISVVSEAMRQANRRAIEAERQAKMASESKSEERYMSTLDNLLEGCQILDHNWHYIYINSTAERHNRRPNEELIGKSYMEMWPGIETTEVFRTMQKCMNDRTSHIMENEFVFPDGTKGWFSLSIQPVPEGIFILSTDISERVHSENYNLMANEILEHLNSNTDSEIMISSVINAIKDRTGYEAIGIRIKDGEDFPYYKTVGFNEDFVNAERHLCSYDKKGSIIRDPDGKPLLDCMCGNILCSRVDPTKSFFTEGGSFRSNNTTLLLATTSAEDRLARTRNKCNSSGYESVGLIPLRSGNEIIGLLQLNDHRVNVFNEETIPFFERMGSSIGIAIMRNKVKNELKELNVELEHRIAERTCQLMDSNKELESFAYSVSHDLRAPLRHVIGFSEKLASELKDNTNPEITRLTGKIKNSASRMSLLIDELLTYSRLGRTELKTVATSLNPIIDEVIKESHDLTINKNLIWNIHKLPDVKVDQTLVKLVFQNLINNSIKFTSKKKDAEIEIGFEEKNKREYIFYVKDNGAGFNMQYADKLFGVFQRLHTTEEFEGTGIGLATVRRIIKRHNGSVWAEGIENEGATFFFTIPK
jgi:PAS domain S-box-containing protein